MSSEFAILLEHVSKIYHIYERPQDRLKQTLWIGKKKFYREFKAVEDVSFAVKKGSTIGIIGRNGSGKSTLLQLIVGTLAPTSGSIALNGRVSALLELGSGFNPEFTGRENAKMNGAIMGLTPTEIEARMPLIEKFAEIGDFIDQPVKIYSSGMFVRLAFACAINVDPDLLIVDEALAVGDMQFQLKCIEKMKAFKKAGKTILFVSHDTYSIRNFCDEAIWMMDGKIHARGDAKTVTDSYQDFMKFGAEDKDAPVVPTDTNENVLSIDKIKFLDVTGVEKKDFYFGEQVSVEISYTLYAPMAGIVGGVALFDKQNTYICGLNTKLDNILILDKPDKYKLTVIYDELFLLPGTYFIDVGFFESSALVRLDYKARADYFRVSSKEYFAEGLAYIKHRWTCKSSHEN